MNNKLFDLLTFPLSPGFRVVEAGAGSGKTHNLVRLVLRMIVGDGLETGPIRAKRILMVTFTEAAALEMRQRVRDLLEQSIEIAGDPDAVLSALRKGKNLELVYIMAGLAPSQDCAGLDEAGLRATLRRRRGLAITALNQLGMMQITTIHGFCMRAYADHAVNAGFPPMIGAPQDGGDVMEEIAADWIRRNGSSRLKLGELTKVVSVLAAEPKADPIGCEQGLAEYVRQRVGALTITTFDSLITKLLHALQPPLSLSGALEPETEGDVRKREDLARSIRRDYDVCMVDESQDTDSRQWQIFSILFGPGTPAGRHRLILVGDPKQSIYGFRGADVMSYCSARDTAAEVYALPKNWRSSWQMIERFNAFFSRAHIRKNSDVADPGFFQTQSIRFLPIPPDAPGAPRGVVDARLGTGSPVEVLHSDDARRVAGLAMEMIRRFDEQSVGRDGGKASGDISGEKRANVAILTRTNSRADLLYRELVALGVPASLESQQSVLTTTTAFQVQLLLRAVLRPSDGGRVQSLLLSRPALFGENRELDPGKLALLSEWLQSCEQVWRRKGFSAAWDKMTREAPSSRTSDVSLDAVVTSLARCQFRHRALADLAHIGELLISRSSRNRWEPEQLLRHLTNRLREQEDGADENGSGDEEQMPDASSEEQLRQETASARVLVRTIHKSKGLEYNGVIIDKAFESQRNKKGGTLVRASDGQVFVYTSLCKGPPKYEDPELATYNKRRGEIADEKKSAKKSEAEAKKHLDEAKSKLKEARALKLTKSEVEQAKAEVEQAELRKSDLTEIYRRVLEQEKVHEEALDSIKAGAVFRAERHRQGSFDHVSAMERQMEQEDARLLYVAMTRARQRLVFAGKAIEDSKYAGFSAIFVSIGLHPSLAAESPVLSSVGEPKVDSPRLYCSAPAPDTNRAVPWRAEPEAPAATTSRVWLIEGAKDLGPKQFEGRFQVGSTSYSNLTKYGSSVPAMQIPDGGQSGTDVGDDERHGLPDQDHFLLPRELGGKEFGNAFHKLMEMLPSFSAKDGSGRSVDFSSLVDRYLGYHLGRIKDEARRAAVRQRLIEALPLWLTTRLARHAVSPDDWFALSDVPIEKTLREVRFSFGAAISAKSRRDIDIAFSDEFSRLESPLEQHKRPLADLCLGATPGESTGRRRGPEAARKRALSYGIDGILTGSIDLFFQEPKQGRYFILDWKTNRLGPAFSDYGDASVVAEMREAKYHLQLAIYSLVVDAYMTARLGEGRWNYANQFGGAYYLFMRAFGADSNESPPKLGVFHHLPSHDFINKIKEAIGPPQIHA